MTDRLNAQQRSANMARIRGTDTWPELLVRRSLHAAGYRFRLHARHLPGRPDIILPRHGTVILVHGCFWHRHPGCTLAYRPKSRQPFWEQKFSSNVARDHRQVRALLNEGWKVIIVWECGLRGASRIASTLESVCAAVASDGNSYQEIPAEPHQELSVRQRSLLSRRGDTEHGRPPTSRSH